MQKCSFKIQDSEGKPVSCPNPATYLVNGLYVCSRHKSESRSLLIQRLPGTRKPGETV